MHLLRSSIPALQYDIFSFTETWLHGGISTAELGFTGYNVFRFDRCVDSSVSERCGGVLLAVKTLYNASQINLDDTSIEHLLVEFNVGSTLIIAGLFYVSPNSNFNIYFTFCSIVEEISIRYPSALICLHGDFNMPFISWVRDHDDCQVGIPVQGATRDQRHIADAVSDMLNFINLSQINSVFNINGSLLDLIFYNSVNYNLSAFVDPVLPIDNYHPPLLLNILITKNINLFIPPDQRIPKYDFKNANLSALFTLLLNIDWRLVLNSPNVNEAVHTFYT